VQHEHAEHVAAAPDAVFAAISARNVPQITAARPTDGDRVEIDARYEGREQHGEASFHDDPAERRIERNSARGYRGWMSMAADGDGSRLTLSSRPGTAASAEKRRSRALRCGETGWPYREAADQRRLSLCLRRTSPALTLASNGRAVSTAGSPAAAVATAEAHSCRTSA
jgi:hypothetical protein